MNIPQRLQNFPNRFRGAWMFLFLLLAWAVCGSLPAQTSHAYLYLDAYEARFECLVGVEEMMDLLGKPAPSMLTGPTQDFLRQSSQARAQTWLEVKFDGHAAKATAPTVNLVKGVPGRTDRPAPDELLMASQTMVGCSWQFDFETVPNSIEITWHGFAGRWKTLPVTVVVGSQSENFELSTQTPTHEWVNRGRLSLRTPLAEVPLPPSRPHMELPLASLLWLGLGMVFLRLRHIAGGRVSGRAFMTWMTLLAGAVILWPVMNISIGLPQNDNVPPEQAEKILRALLRNTYHAFDQPSESAIYDQLDRSIHGDLLQKIYLQTIEALTLDAQDKTRVRVTDLDVQVTATHPRKDGPGFIADVRWTVLGTVGHWGHEHQRVNRYLAQVTIAPVEEKSASSEKSPSAWKIVGLEVQEEKRI